MPAENVIGEAGEYMRAGWQTRFTPHYAASFLGAADAALDCALDYVRTQSREADPDVQTRIGELATNVHTGNLWLRHVAELFESGRIEEAKIAAVRTRYSVHHLTTDAVRHAISCCGARSLNRPSRLERIFRDLSFYVLHDNLDHVLATIGRHVLGQHHDQRFFGNHQGGSDGE